MSSFFVNVVYLVEYAVPKYRVVSSNIIIVGSTSSFLFIDVFAYYVRTWRHLSLYTALVSLPIILFFLILPESSKWLNCKGRKEEAENILGRISKFDGNARKVMLKPLTMPSDKTNYSYIDLFRKWKISKITLSISLLWFSVPTAYYVIMMASANLATDTYASFALSCVADLPAFFISAYLCSRLGHKKANLGCLVLSGVLLEAIAVVPSSVQHRSIIVTALAFFARVVCASTFYGLYPWTTDIFPTLLRSQGISISAVFAKLGMVLIPFMIKVLQEANPIFPFVIVGVMIIIASLVGLILPETANKPATESYSHFLGPPISNKTNSSVRCNIQSSSSVRCITESSLSVWSVGNHNIAFEDENNIK